MLKTLRLRRFFGGIAAMLGVAALALAQTSDPPGATCKLEDAGWATADGGCKDLVTGLVWGSGGDNLQFNAAQSWCSALVEGGFSDWRTPTIADIQNVAPHGFLTHHPFPYFNYWTSQSRGNKAYVGDVRNGSVGLTSKTRMIPRMCVRP